MTIPRPVVLYGASGSTGRLVTEYLREYGVPFVVVGRNKPGWKASGRPSESSSCTSCHADRQARCSGETCAGRHRRHRRSPGRRPPIPRPPRPPHRQGEVTCSPRP